MMRSTDYLIRPSQIIHTFGPGSIYDSRDDSFLIMGVDYWKKENCRQLDDDALLQHLRKTHKSLTEFRIPSMPGSDDDQVAIKTFPRWGICPKCSMLQTRNAAKGGMRCINKSCEDKNGKRPSTVPARFVAACENGHLEDFPWHRWTHKDSEVDCAPREARIFITDKGTSASLKSLVVECKTCGAKNSMADALSQGSLRYIGRCRGRRPWLREDDPECADHEGRAVFLRGIYKGASNFYFGNVVRAITIPPYSSFLAREVIAQDRTTGILGKPIPGNEALSYMFPRHDPDEVREMIKSIKSSRTSSADIRTKEFGELDHARYPDKGPDHGYFRTEPVQVPSKFSDYLSNLVLVNRLREVITITGFYRMDPKAYGSAEVRRPSPVGTDTNWLPAVENIGEGIFFSLDSQKIASWAETDGVKNRFKGIGEPSSLSDIEATPRYALLHGISHLVIKEISNYAGYSTLSLRERIYSGPNMAGILIYTSSSSNDGSLGGLIEQGRTNKFAMIFQRALANAELCSMDPLCSSTGSTTSERSGGSACHACLYLPETSCESSNSILDRAMIGQTLTREGVGFFDS